MFGRTVTIDGTEIWVSCDPSTPISEVLRRAADKVLNSDLDRPYTVDLRPYIEGRFWEYR